MNTRSTSRSASKTQASKYLIKTGNKSKKQKDSSLESSNKKRKFTEFNTSNSALQENKIKTRKYKPNEEKKNDNTSNMNNLSKESDLLNSNVRLMRKRKENIDSTSKIAMETENAMVNLGNLKQKNEPSKKEENFSRRLKLNSKRLCLNPTPTKAHFETDSSPSKNKSSSPKKIEVENSTMFEEVDLVPRTEGRRKKLINIEPQQKLIEQQKEQKILKRYIDAIEKLQEYALPDSIPCREEEKKIITEFLLEGLQNKGSNQTLYISGIPGIGKTVTFLEVIRNLQNFPEQEFKFININGMSLKDPENIYLLLLEEITGIKNVSKSTACIILNDLFRTNKIPKQYNNGANIVECTKIILLDELDYLMTKDQTILYNLFEWPHCKFAKMIMAGIANTVDFPEKLQPKIASRIGNQRLTYKPYTSKQIERIVGERIQTINDVFDPNAITFVSKKIAVFSSDIRRTLNVCRKAVEICQEEILKIKDFNQFKQITIDHISASYNLLYSTPYVECLKKFSRFQKVLLIALAIETKTQVTGRVSFCKIYDRFRTMMNNLGQSNPLKANQALQIFYQMMVINLVLVKEKDIIKTNKTKSKEANNDYFTNIKDYDINICISLDDITNALKDDDIFQDYINKF